MKKGITICIGVAIVVIAIFVGIASIPDEVLIESPSFETSENQPTTETPTAEEPAAEEPAAEEPAAEEPAAEEPAAETSESEDDNVIKVEIQDGVGSGDR